MQKGLLEKWIACANDRIAAKEVTVAPGATVVFADEACYCALAVQGHGTFGVFDCEASGVPRFNDISGDEFFVFRGRGEKGYGDY
jgi:hypothetical protein